MKKNLIPEESAWVIDGMSLVQRFDANHISFGDVYLPCC